MKNNITLKTQAAFVSGVTRGLVEIGAEIQPKDELSFPCTKFKLKTIAGTLNITLYDSQAFLFTVFSKFEDVERAKYKFNCNPHSGKYNFQKCQNKALPSIKLIIDCALMHFECTLPKEIES